MSLYLESADHDIFIDKSISAIIAMRLEITELRKAIEDHNSRADLPEQYRIDTDEV
jgi:hypothetical protein